MINKKKILLIDYYNLFIRNFVVVPITNEDGEHFGGCFGFLKSMKSAIDMFNPDVVYVISDGPQAALRRKLIDKNYKADRKKEFKRGIIKAYDFLNEQEYQDNFNMQLQRLEKYLSILPIKYMSVPYVEADDIIAEITNTLSDNEEAIIYSTDADYKQLINDNVSCYNPVAKLLSTKSVFLKKHGYLPDNYIYFKLVNGDKSDGVTGISGIGEKTFIKLFPEMKTESFDDIEDMLEQVRHALDSGAKKYTKSILGKYQLLAENEDLLYKNWKLMQLQDVDVSIQCKDMIKRLIASNPNKFNRIKLRIMFMQDKLGGAVKYFDDWSRVFSRLMIGRG